jgi:DNA gyrase/topoisomerase IV subunit A
MMKVRRRIRRDCFLQREAQARAFGQMEHARLMGLELQKAKAEVARLQAEAKLKDEQLSLMQLSKDGRCVPKMLLSNARTGS